MVVVFLRRARRNELHALGNDPLARVTHQEMNVVGGHHLVEHAQPEAFLGLEQPAQVTAPVACELEQERLLVAAVGDVLELAGQEMTIGAGHGSLPSSVDIAPK